MRVGRQLLRRGGRGNRPAGRPMHEAEEAGTQRVEAQRDTGTTGRTAIMVQKVKLVQ